MKNLIEPFQDVARKFKSKVGKANLEATGLFILLVLLCLFSNIIFLLQIMFIFVDIKVENLAKPFLTLFGLEESEDTVVSSINYSLMRFNH